MTQEIIIYDDYGGEAAKIQMYPLEGQKIRVELHRGSICVVKSVVSGSWTLLNKIKEFILGDDYHGLNTDKTSEQRLERRLKKVVVKMEERARAFRDKDNKIARCIIEKKSLDELNLSTLETIAGKIANGIQKKYPNVKKNEEKEKDEEKGDGGT